MLPRKHGRRYEDRRLLARENALHHGTQRDLGLAEANVAAQQAVHQPVGLHIVLDLGNAAQLIVGFLVGKILLKLTLPRVIRREGVALDLGALGIQLDETLGKLLCRRFGACFRLAPVRAAELVQPHALVVAAADVFGDKIERGCRNIQKIRSRKRNFDEIALGTVHRHTLHSDKPTDTVVLMHDKITRCQVGVRLHLVTVGLLDLRFLSPGKNLTLGHDNKAEIGILKTGGQRALHDVDAAALGQQVADFYVETGVGQRVQHVPAAQRTAAHDRHRASLLGVAADVGRRHVEIAAVGVHLVGNKVFQMLRRQLGHIVEKAVQTQNLAFHAAYADKIERIFSQIRRHFAALEQRGYVIGYTRVEIADSVTQTRRVLDDDDGIFGQIVERGRHFGINERHILVRCGQRTGLAQTFRVPFEISLQICVLLLPAGRGECQNSLCQSCRTALRQCRNGFHAWQTAQALALLQPALTADVERGD